MTGDPSRKPSNERVRIDTDLQKHVWIECDVCFGDGWHYPMSHRGLSDGARKSSKSTCLTCDGVGARRVLLIQCEPGVRIVPPPPGFAE